MKNLALILNGIVVFTIGSELVLALGGRVSPDQLLLSSGLASLLIVISVKLIKNALLQLYGLNASRQESIKNEINILSAITSHVALHAQLQKLIEGTATETLDPSHACRDDACELGKWLNGPALEHFRDNERFGVLRSSHATLHATAAKIIANLENNQRDSAEQLLNNEYRKAARLLTTSLGELHKIIPVR